MADPIREYQEAVRLYNEAHQVARARIKIIADVSDALAYKLPSFLGWQYGISVQTTPYDRNAKFDMANWPDEATLKSVMLDWHQKFVAMQEAWTRVRQADHRRAREFLPGGSREPRAGQGGGLAMRWVFLRQCDDGVRGR